MGRLCPKVGETLIHNREDEFVMSLQRNVMLHVPTWTIQEVYIRLQHVHETTTYQLYQGQNGSNQSDVRHDDGMAQ
jgi:hypothetical protein